MTQDELKVLLLTAGVEKENWGAGHYFVVNYPAQFSKVFPGLEIPDGAHLRVADEHVPFLAPLSRFAGSVLVASDRIPKPNPGLYLSWSSVVLAIKDGSIHIIPYQFYKKTTGEVQVRSDLWWSDDETVAVKRAARDFEGLAEKPAYIITSKGNGVYGYFLRDLTPRNDTFQSKIPTLHKYRGDERNTLLEWEKTGTLRAITPHKDLVSYPKVGEEFAKFLAEYAMGHGGIGLTMRVASYQTVPDPKSVFVNYEYDSLFAQEDFWAAMLAHFPYMEPVLSILTTNEKLREMVLGQILVNHLSKNT